MITSTNKPLHNTTIMPIFIWQSLLKTIILIITIFFTNDLSAQGVKMTVNYIAPEWNGTKVCDGGGGYNPTPITAPSISYSSSDVNAIKEGKYDYTWRQKINNEEWQTVSSGKSVNFIPAFNPPLLFNAPSGSALKTYSYQLIIKDISNGGQESKSEIFSLSLASGISALYQVTPSNKGRDKYSIQLKTNGGYPSKQFSWSSSRNINIPQDMIHAESPEGLSKGIYIVEIKDIVCPLKTETINMNELTKQDNNK